MGTIYFYDKYPHSVSAQPASNAPLSGNLQINYSVSKEASYCCFASSSSVIYDVSDYELAVIINGVEVARYDDASGLAYEGSHQITVPYSGLSPSTTYQAQIVVVSYHLWRYYNSQTIYTKRICNESASANFSTILGPLAFNLLTPANNATGQSRRPNFTWQASQYADGYRAFLTATERAFGSDVDYAQLIKTYGPSTPVGYSPPELKETTPIVINGNPDKKHISTSYVERQNLTIRMAMRRFTRLTNAFSKKLENLKAAVALHFWFYNFARIHQTLRVTPAMEAKITDHIWGWGELFARN